MLKTTRFMLGLLLLCTIASAEVPNVINYQGYLTDNGGAPLDGDYAITFTIYDAPSGGTARWTSSAIVVTVSNGFFSYYLGMYTTLPADLFDQQGRWLGIKVGSDPEISPRSILTSMPYAHHAAKADTANYVAGVSGSGWVDDGGVVRLETNNDRVGIGTSSASEPLVVGRNLGNFGGSYIVSGSPYQDDYCGFVMGYSADRHAIMRWDGDGHSFSIGTVDNGTTYNNVLNLHGGRVGISSGPYFAALLNVEKSFTVASYETGIRSSVSGAAVGEILYGAYMEANNTGSSSTGYGVYGNATSDLGNRYGVYGKASNESGGISSAGDSYGGKFTGFSDELGIGVYALASSSGERFGVYALSSQGSTTNYGVYCYGNLHSTGSNTKVAGGYKIDHPEDPENMYLTHSDVSSPEMMNIYNGNITTDADGRAVVEMPGYFESLNTDFRYQLTVIGSFAQAIIAEEIKGNVFIISTDKPFVKVSWMVTGIRQDAFAKSKLLDVEIDKPAEERGFYQNPELFGHGIEKAVDYKHFQPDEN